jgi:hypothetical protein
MSEFFNFEKSFLELHKDEYDEATPENDADLDTIVKSKKEKKKKKKKRKSSFEDKLEFLMDDIKIDNDLKTSDSIIMDDDDDYLLFKSSKKGKKKDLFDMKEARKQKKKNVEARFNPQLAQLQKVLKDSDASAEMIKQMLETMMKSKTRYAGKTLTDLFQALNSANSNRASVIRDISNINKTILDIKLKMDKNNPKKQDQETDNEDYGANLFQRIFSGSKGRKDIMDNAREYYSNINTEQSNDNDSEDIDDAIFERLQNEGNEFRTEDGSKYIEYENQGAEDCIMVYPNGDWEPEAIDKYNQRLPEDYPRLKKEDLVDLRLDMDTKIATDKYGRKFKIIESI